MIAFSQVSSAVNSSIGSTTNTTSPSITALTNGIALVWIESSGADPTTVVWGATNQMDKINTFLTGTARGTNISLWGRLVGTTSTGTVAITATFASAVTSNMLYGTYSGVSQSTAITSLQNSTNGTTGAGTSNNELTTAITPSLANSWLVAFSIDLAAGRTPKAGTTARFTGNFKLFDSNAVVSGSSTLGFDLTTFALYGNNAVVLPPFIASNTNSSFFSFM